MYTNHIHCAIIIHPWGWMAHEMNCHDQSNRCLTPYGFLRSHILPPHGHTMDFFLSFFFLSLSALSYICLSRASEGPNPNSVWGEMIKSTPTLSPMWCCGCGVFTCTCTPTIPCGSFCTHLVHPIPLPPK